MARPAGQEGGAGRNVLLRDALENAGAYIDQSFAAQPAVRIRLHRTLGNSLLMLGGYQPARVHFEAADKILSADGDKTQHDDLANALDVAKTFHQAGDLFKARTQLQTVLSGCEEHLGATSPLTLDVKHHLAEVKADLGQAKEALELRQQTLEERRRQLGPNHRDTLASMVSLARSWKEAGQASDALKLSEEALEKLKANLGNEHPDTLACLRIIGELYANRGDEKKSLEILEGRLSDLTQQLGPDHDATLQAMQDLAVSYFRTERAADASRLYQNAITRRKSHFGANHIKTIRLERDWAKHLVSVGRIKVVTPLLEDTLARARIVMGAHDPITIDCMRLLANCYAAQDREQAALELHIEAYQRSRDSFGPEHAVTLDRMFDLAIDYNRLQAYSVALELRQQAYDIQKELDDPSNPELLLSMNALAQSHLMVRQSEPAIELLRKVIERRELRAVAAPEDKDNACHLAYSLGQLGHAEELRGNWDKGHEWYQQCAESFAKARKKFGSLDGFFESVANYYQLRDGICQKSAKAIQDVAYAERQAPQQAAELLMTRLYHMLRTKDVAEAAATAEALESLLGKRLTTAYQAGVAWSLVSTLADDDATRGVYAARAIRLLDRVKAKEGALFQTPTVQAYAFHFNPDLAPVRERAEFQAILERLPKMGKDLIWLDKRR